MATTKAPEPSATVGSTSAGDDDYAKDAVEQPQAHVLAAPHQEDYPVERVEAVYRKLDMRIIPGRSCLLVLVKSDQSYHILSLLPVPLAPP